jgi:hypothetical protein
MASGKTWKIQGICSSGIVREKLGNFEIFWEKSGNFAISKSGKNQKLQK